MRLAVLGSPIGHSLSPVMHEAALDSVGIPGRYEALDVDAHGFADAVVMMREGGLDGANVTMPHKARAFAACDRRSSLARRTGAVNTLTVRRGGIVGANTDVTGIRSAWVDADLPTDTPVVVLGAGGAAAAAVVALSGRPLRVIARRLQSAQDMIARARVEATASEWGDSIPPSVVVNATPIGMAGETLPEELLNPAVGLFDMAYGNQRTAAVRTLLVRGIPVAEGLDMLVGQAVASFQIWTGYKVEPSVMREAALAELSRREQSQ